jgi:hypothetical protein
MRIVQRVAQFVSVILLLVTCSALSAQNPTAQKDNHPIRNIVLVHGAWADASGWKGVFHLLTKRVLALQDGPCILVAHSYGGAVMDGSWDRSIRRRFGVHRSPYAGCRGE